MILLNDEPVEVTRFPDNTTQVWKLPENQLKTNPAVVRWDFKEEGEFLALAQLKTLLDAHEIRASLVLSYLPYGRQDKEVSNTATFALRSFAPLLNSLHFDTVMITDPHSLTACELIGRSRPAYPTPQLDEVIEYLGTDLVCYPDKGAVLKYSLLYPFPHIWGEKQRDPLTGKILKYQLCGGCAGKRVLIVDDICDGGMTFIFLAKDLLSAGATEVSLFVSHGIFSKGLKPLTDAGIKGIFTPQGEVFEFQGQLAFKEVE